MAAQKKQVKDGNEITSLAQESIITDIEDIAKLAYYKAEKRGFAPGSELDDWLEAENELSVHNTWY